MTKSDKNEHRDDRVQKIIVDKKLFHLTIYNITMEISNYSPVVIFVKPKITVQMWIKTRNKNGYAEKSSL